MKPMLLAIVLLICGITAGCGTPRVNRLTNDRFPTTAPDQEIKLYVNEIRRPHVKIAQVQSFADPDQNKDVKRRQLEEIRETARSLGADAVMSIRQHSQQVRGMVRDERTPFPSLRQGAVERHFLRGVAIRYVSEEDASRYPDPLAEAETSGAASDIPSSTSGRSDLDSPSEVLPRGLGPIFK